MPLLHGSQSEIYSREKTDHHKNFKDISGERNKENTILIRLVISQKSL
jgi:hypothetical protein